jgi:hypothetical protein
MKRILLSIVIVLFVAIGYLLPGGFLCSDYNCEGAVFPYECLIKAKSMTQLRELGVLHKEFGIVPVKPLKADGTVCEDCYKGLEDLHTWAYTSASSWDKVREAGYFWCD